MIVALMAMLYAALGGDGAIQFITGLAVRNRHASVTTAVINLDE